MLPIAHQVDAEISESLSEVSQVIFFLLGAMTVVEVVDAHQVREGGSNNSWLKIY